MAVGRFVTSVAWNLNLVVLNHVLLNDGLTGTEGASLSNGLWVEINLRNETIVAWDVRCRLCGSHRQFVMLVTLSF